MKGQKNNLIDILRYNTLWNLHFVKTSEETFDSVSSPLKFCFSIFFEKERRIILKYSDLFLLKKEEQTMKDQNVCVIEQSW